MTTPDYQKISRAHGLLNMCVLAYLVTYGTCLYLKGSPSALLPAFQILLVLVSLWSCYAVVRLASTMHSRLVTIVYALIVLIPGIGGLALSLASNSANNHLKRAGYKVGFFGSITSGPPQAE